MRLVRNLAIFFVLFAVIAVTAFYFIINSTYAAQRITDRYASKYGFSFGEFSGNAVEGLQTDGIYFHDKKMANSVKLNISATALLTGKIKISNLELLGVDKENLFGMVKYFVEKSKKSKKRKKLINFSYEISDGVMTTLPYVMGGMSIDSTRIESSYLFYKKGLFEGDIESIQVKSKLGDINASCSYFDKVLKVDNIVAVDVDSLKIANRLKENNKTTKQAVVKKEKKRSTSPFVPDKMIIKRASLVVMPRALDGLHLETSSIKGAELEMDFVDKVSSGSLWVESASKVAKIKISAQLSPDKISLEKISLDDVNLTALDQYLKSRPKKKSGYKKIAYIPSKISVSKVDIQHINGKMGAVSYKAGRIKADGNRREFDLLNEDASVKLKGQVSIKGSIGKDSLTIKESSDKLQYWIYQKNYALNMDAKISTKYSNDISVKVEVSNKDGLAYRMDASSKSVEVSDTWNGLLTGLSIKAIGSSEMLEAHIESDYMRGEIISTDAQKALVKINTKQPIPLARYITLPQSLSATKANLEIEAPIRLNNAFPIEAKVSMKSNLFDFRGVLYYNKLARVDGKINFPQNTILNNINNKIKYTSFSPLAIEVGQNNSGYDILLSNSRLSVDGQYSSVTKNAKAIVKLPASRAVVSIDKSGSISIVHKSSSLGEMMREIDRYYPIGEAPLDGDVEIDARLDGSNGFRATVKSSVIYMGSKNRGEGIKNINMVFSGDSQDIVLESYEMEIKGSKVFATKPSRVSMKNGSILANPLWVNDKLETRGRYDMSSGDGSFSSLGSGIVINHDLISTVLTADVDSVVAGKKKSFKGDIHLEGGDIKYDLQKATIANDSDIVVLQRVKKKNDNTYIKDIKLDISLDSSKPLLYKQDGINLQMIPDLHVKKEYGKSAVIKGEVTLLSGGYYIYDGKKFVLRKSHIFFKKRSLSPVLDIKADYKHAGKSTLISITGTSKNPVLNFNSANKNEVLSDILFDTEGGAGDNKSGDVGKLIAGSVAKKLLRGMGLEVDHLVFKGGGFEIGKKISKKITVIYDQEESSSLKVRIENSKQIETDISFGKDSGSIDMYYKKEF